LLIVVSTENDRHLGKFSKTEVYHVFPPAIDICDAS
jgi:hypothetical protein